MHQYLTGLIIFLLSSTFCFAQEAEWLTYYDQIKEASITDRFFKHKDIVSLIKPLKADERFDVTKVGESLEGRAIYCIKLGSGERKVLMWSQMHGDEATATMALMDVFNFFQDRSIAEDWKEHILSDLTLYIVPMLNPDGAERFNRRNAAFIDLNRDAMRLQSPESRILKRLVDSLEPEFGFNLHDQSKYYTAGYSSDSTATFSFLAPAYNSEREVNTVRLKAMQLIGSLNEYVQQYLPGKVGRFSDSFEPRAFGDNITKWGTSTVLFECGGLKGDPEKQTIRKVHFGLFLHAFDCIVKNCYDEFNTQDYKKIPPNSRSLHDLIIREVMWKKEGHTLLLDMAFQRVEVEINNHNGVTYKGQLVDVGDLSTQKAYEVVNMDSLEIVEPKIYSERIEEPRSDLVPRWRQLVKEGYAIFYTESQSVSLTDQQGPIHWIQYGSGHMDWEIEYYGNPTFYLADPDSRKLKYLVNNGRMFDLNAL